MSGVVTGRSGYDADGNLWVYQPPGMTLVQAGPATGVTVSYGAWQTLEPGELIGPGTYEIGATSGGLQGQDRIEYRTVTISEVTR